ncbi:hypothetical protein LguiB_019399 [Lonicera macranthoides]
MDALLEGKGNRCVNGNGKRGLSSPIFDGRYSSTKAFCIAFVLTFFNTFHDLPVAFQALIIFLYLFIVMILTCWFIFLSEMSSN